MDNLQNVFEYGENKVRVIIKNGEPWFVARDICDILKHTNSRVAVDRLDDDEKGVSKVYTPGGLQEMTVVSESGLYALVLTSNLPEAKRFKKWVTSEVLPRIRKTGAYITGAIIPQTYPEALRALADEVEKREAVEAEKQKLLPKAESYDSLMSTDGLFSMSNTAKILNYQGAGPQNIFKVLAVEDIFFKRGDRYSVYQEYIRRGYFQEKATTYRHGDRIEAYKQIFATPKGLDWLDRFLAERGYEKNTRKEAINCLDGAGTNT